MNELKQIGENLKKFSTGVVDSLARVSAKLLAKKHKMDPERILVEVKKLVQESSMTCREAHGLVKERIRDHGQPELYEAPEPERCPNCKAVKGECGIGCRAFPPRPMIPPDKPGWMGSQDDSVTKEEPPESAPEEAEPWPCKCGGGVPYRAQARTGALGWVCRQDCGRNVFMHGTWPEVAEEWNKHHGINYNWDSPIPCTCGSTDIISYSMVVSIECRDCGRSVDFPCDDIDDQDQRALVFRAWTEAKGRPGRTYFVESEEPAEGSVVVPNPCKCGAGVPESREVTLNTRGHQWWVECRSKTCPNYASGESQIDATGYWNEDCGVQPKEEAEIAVTVHPEPTWENPGPCACGEDEPKQWHGANLDYYIQCSGISGGCGLTAWARSKYLTLKAWVKRRKEESDEENDHGMNENSYEHAWPAR